MKLHIESYPNLPFRLKTLCYTRDFTIDVSQAVKKKLGEKQEVIHSLALKILKAIKWKSDILAFLTKPIIFIPLSFVTVAAGWFFSVKGLIVRIIGMIVSFIGGTMLGISFSKDFLSSKISKAYRDQSERLSEYIEYVKNSKENVHFSFNKLGLGY